MPNRASDNDVGLVPTAKPDGETYEKDFYGWTIEQARCLREGRWAAVDRENVAEEIESLGREQFDKLESALRVLLMHMLKWDYQPERRGRSWMLSIEAQRVRVERVLDTNPGLKPRISEAVMHGYRLARLEATQETGLDKRTFPDQCPYNWDDITKREFGS
jgi:hypothetical protein